MVYLQTGEAERITGIPKHVISRAVKKSPGLPGVIHLGRFIGIDPAKLDELRDAMIEKKLIPTGQLQNTAA